MINTGIKPLLNTNYSGSLVKQNKKSSSLNALTCDSVCFLGKKKTVSGLEIAKLIDSIAISDWKPAKKGHTKISRIKEYKHPEYGRIKIGLSLDPTLNSGCNFKTVYTPKAFIDIPKSDFKLVTSDENNFLYKFAAKIVGQESVEELKAKGTANEQQAINSFNKMLEESDCDKKRKNRQINYLA